MTSTILIVILACSIGFGIAGVVIGIFFWLQHRQRNISASNQNQLKTIIPANVEGENNVNHQKIEAIIPTKLVIANDVNHPLIEIERYSTPEQIHMKNMKKLDLPKESISNISAMLQQAPNLLANAAISSGKYYAVTFMGNPEKLLHTSDGVYKAIAVGQNGKFQEIGNVQQWMKGAGVAVAVWQVMAVITAQKFLSDIDKRLQKIEKGLIDITQFLESERKSKLEGNLIYLRQIAGTIRSGNITPIDCHTMDNQIEHIERECSQIISHIKKDMDASLSEINSHVYNEDLTIRWTKSGLKESVSIINDTVDNYTCKTQSLLLALQVKMAALILKGSLPVNKQILDQRIGEIDTSLCEAREKTENFSYEAEEVANMLESEFSFEETDSELKEALISDTKEKLDPLNNIIDDLEESFKPIQDRIESEKMEIKEPMKLIVSMDKHGQVQEIRQPLLINNGKLKNERKKKRSRVKTKKYPQR